MRALVTGGRGFIGQALLRTLRRSSDWTEVFEHPGPLSDSPEALRDAPAFDTVFHLAAHTPKGGAPSPPEHTIGSNVDGLRALLTSVEGKCGSFIFASTLDVYSREACREIIDEAAELAPRSLYGASKWIGEEMCRGWSMRTGIPVAILRFGHIYGPGEDSYRKLIPEAIRKGLRQQPFILYGAEDSLRDLMFVDDVARATVLAGRQLGSRELGIVNVASGSSVTLGEILSLISRLLPQPLAVERRAGGDAGTNYRFDVTKLRTVLGFQPSVSLPSGLEQEVQWFRGRMAS